MIKTQNQIAHERRQRRQKAEMARINANPFVLQARAEEFIEAWRSECRRRARLAQARIESLRLPEQQGAALKSLEADIQAYTASSLEEAARQNLPVCLVNGNLSIDLSREPLDPRPASKRHRASRWMFRR